MWAWVWAIVALLAIGTNVATWVAMTRWRQLAQDSVAILAVVGDAHDFTPDPDDPSVCRCGVAKKIHGWARVEQGTGGAHRRSPDNT